MFKIGDVLYFKPTMEKYIVVGKGADDAYFVLEDINGKSHRVSLQYMRSLIKDEED